jgi:hypothetical protein
MDLNLPEPLAQRIEKLAQSQGLSPTDWLEHVLKQHEQQSTATQQGTFQALAESAIAADIHAGQPMNDTAARSREILTDEFAAYLNSRLEDDGNVSTD